MGSLGVLLTVVTAAAISGYLAFTVARRKQARVRRYFLLGYACGFATVAVMRGRRRTLKVLRVLDAATASCRSVSQPRELLSSTGRLAAYALPGVTSRRTGVR